MIRQTALVSVDPRAEAKALTYERLRETAFAMTPDKIGVRDLPPGKPYGGLMEFDVGSDTRDSRCKAGTSFRR